MERVIVLPGIGEFEEKEKNSIQKTGIRIADGVMYLLIYVSAGIAVALLIGMLGYVLTRGVSVVNRAFLTTVTSVLKGTTGIAGNILNTIYMVVLTLLIAAPIGIGSAIYLNEYAKAGKVVKIIQFTTETLSGIPSIIFGLFGMVFFGTTLGFGYSILTGSLTLTIMVLPLITRNTQEALKTVPDSYRSGALGMGATKWYMIRTILLPSALPGIVTGVILAIGRIVGESAALLFTAGSGFLLPRTAEGYLTKIMEPGGTLTIQLYLSMTKGQYDVAFGIATVLLVIVLAINIFTKILAGRLDVNRRK
ncbi:MAG: phosphate ABC transporter permease PstA [Lachnospiraceae bacterium]|nr:phosphate ABC transporter permease PstA [Lachnospiraceae bacterium]